MLNRRSFLGMLSCLPFLAILKETPPMPNYGGSTVYGYTNYPPVGRHGHFIIVDDPYTPMETRSVELIPTDLWNKKPTIYEN